MTDSRNARNQLLFANHFRRWDKGQVNASDLKNVENESLLELRAQNKLLESRIEALETAIGQRLSKGLRFLQAIRRRLLGGLLVRQRKQSVLTITLKNTCGEDGQFCAQPISNPN